MRILLLMALVAFGGCTTNGVYDNAKTWTLIGGVVVGGAIAVAAADSGKSAQQLNCFWVIDAQGSHQVCR